MIIAIVVVAVLGLVAWWVVRSAIKDIEDDY